MESDVKDTTGTIDLSGITACGFALARNCREREAASGIELALSAALLDPHAGFIVPDINGDGRFQGEHGPTLGDRDRLGQYRFLRGPALPRLHFHRMQ